MPEVHSTRLFPKGQGAAAYRITGIAARCDWVVLSDPQPPRAVLVRRRPGPPRTLFLSLRDPVPALRFFAGEVLPLLTRPFVLVSGSEDVTVPRQLDTRWPPFAADTGADVQAILAHPLLRRWHAENLDDDSDPRLRPLPLGRVFPDGAAGRGEPPDPPPPTAGRPLRMLCAHRRRDGAQWQARRDVDALCRGPWAPWSTAVDGELTEAEFVAQLRRHAFVLCVEGGGLDPSPKAWQAIAHGAIPIVRDSPLREAYGLLPVVFVPDWQAEAIDEQWLRQWAANLSAEHDLPERRARVLQRLGLDFWWQRVQDDLDDPPVE